VVTYLIDVPILERPLLRSYERGCTPNPDVLCNRFVKFNFLAKKLLRVEGNSGSASADDQETPPVRVDAIATGHYCQTSFQTRPDGESCLLRSVDSVKDQTFWLSTISHKHLRHFMFPVGGLLKPVVKQIATDIGLSSIAKRR
ncbi:tRNA methyl transferase, partial [Opisthorchis viverrini]